VETPAASEHETKPDERHEIPRKQGSDDMSTTPEQISTQSAFDLIRRIAGTVKTSQNAAEATQISDSLAELNSIIRSLQKTMTELHVENHRLKRQLQAVVDLKMARKQFRYERSVYWKYDEAGKRVDGPFCPRCLEEDQIRRLTPGAANGLYQCLHHKALFTIAPGGEAVRAAGR
jgi:hypothetical protein